MSSWRVSEDPPADFLQLLYDEEDVVDDMEEVEDNEEVEDTEEVDNNEVGDIEEMEVLYDEVEDGSKTPEAPVYSPLTSPERHMRPLQIDEPTPSTSRDRSRSPIRRQSPSEIAHSTVDCGSGVVVAVYDEYGVQLDAEEDGAFLAPDAHLLYVSEVHERGMDGRRPGRRGGRRGGRSERGRNEREGGHQKQGRRGGNQWKVGHPLNEIWTTDADVPPELVRLAKDVVRRRQESMTDDIRLERNDERESDSENEEFVDASDGEHTTFEWSPMETFKGQEETFRIEHTGSVQSFKTAYDAFRSYWSDGILSHIVTETNQYAAKIVSPTFHREWYNTNLHEILCLFAFWMMLGIIRMPTVTSCFSVDPLLKTEVFRRIFTRRRYEMLCRALHFVESDPGSSVSNTSTDPLYSLRPIITHLNSTFQSNYVLNKDICIDESLTLWKGRLGFKQYIQNKAAKFGIKTFELCESVTGYLWSFIVYSGKQSATDLEQSPGELKSTTVVKKLIGPLLNKGYRLFMDNWYNSPRLARFLKLNGTDCVGTLRASRKDVPILINKAPLKRGQFIARHSGDISVLSWQDKKRITMISTCHGASCALPTVPSRPKSRSVPFKPQVVLDYNIFMGGVDLKDQMLEPYLLERKRCTKWYMKLFKRLLNVTINNSRILLVSSSQKHHDHLVFRLQLVDSLLTNHLSLCPLSRKNNVSSSRSEHNQPGRYILSTHWPILIEPTEASSSSNRNFRKRCFVCLQEGRKSQKTPYCCESCQVPLCIKNCFKAYHTSQ